MQENVMEHDSNKYIPIGIEVLSARSKVRILPGPSESLLGGEFLIIVTFYLVKLNFTYFSSIPIIRKDFNIFFY